MPPGERTVTIAGVTSRPRNPTPSVRYGGGRVPRGPR